MIFPTKRVLWTTPFSSFRSDPSTAKLQQLSWHLSDFQVNKFLNVAFGFKLLSFILRSGPYPLSALSWGPNKYFKKKKFSLCFMFFTVCLCISSPPSSFPAECLWTKCRKRRRTSDNNCVFLTRSHGVHAGELLQGFWLEDGLCLCLGFASAN